MKPYPVLIEWVDSADIGAATWLSPDGLEEDDVSPCSVVSVGWLVQKSKSAVLLTLCISEGGDVRGAFVIPRVNIKRLVRLSPTVK